MMCRLAYGITAAFLLLGAVQVHAWLAWGVCIPLVLGHRRAPGWRAGCLTGVAFGLTAAVCGDALWVANAGERYFGLSPVRSAAAAGVLALWCGGAFGGLLGGLMHCALRLPGAWRILAAAAAWTAWEALTISVVPYYPWVSLAGTQVDLAVLQAASVAGQGGLSWAMAATGTAFGLALHSRAKAGAAIRCALIGLAIAGVVVGFGSVRLLTTSMAASGCAVGAIDASIESAQIARPLVMERYRTLSERALSGHPSVIVWPESAVPGYPETDAALQRQLRALVADWGVPLIAGGPRIDWASGWKQRLFNSAYQIEATGPLRAYDKRWLVPFAEYWPQAMGQRPGWLSAEEVTAGRTPVVFTAGACRLGALICFEAEPPALATELVRAGADGLLVLSNDAQLPARAIDKEVIQARLRAVETGRPVVRAANRGVSVAIDGLGRVVRQGQDGVLSVRLASSVTAPAVWLAPLFLALCWLGCVATVGVRVWRYFRPGEGQSLPKLSCGVESD